MRRLALVSIVLLALSAGSAFAFMPSHPVPASVEKQIAKRAGLESYSPARMMTGWHYQRWQYVPGELRIWFTNRSNWPVKFVVTPLLAKTCAAGKQQTFQLAGQQGLLVAEHRSVARLPAAGVALREEPVRPLDAHRRLQPGVGDEARRRRPRRASPRPAA